MKRTTKYVAFDVHQATTVASVRDDSGRVLARSVLETHGPSIVEFLCGMRGALHVAFEVGTQSQWLHDLVAPIEWPSVIRVRWPATATRAIRSMPTGCPSCCGWAGCARSITAGGLVPPTVGADCQGKERHAISGDEVCP